MITATSSTITIAMLEWLMPVTIDVLLIAML